MVEIRCNRQPNIGPPAGARFGTGLRAGDRAGNEERVAGEDGPAAGGGGHASRAPGESCPDHQSKGESAARSRDWEVEGAL